MGGEGGTKFSSSVVIYVNRPGTVKSLMENIWIS
jgi:hypothetical protein